MEHLEEEAKKVINSLKPIEMLFPKKPPYQRCAEFLASKKFTKELPKKTFDFEDLSQRTPALTQHFTLKDYYKIDKDLKIARINANEQKKSMELQWKELEEKEIEFRNTLIQFNEFMEQNQEKRERASLKEKELTVRLEQKTNDLNKLESELKQMKELVELLNKVNNEYSIYEKFLLEVAKSEQGNFGSIDEIFKRFIALVKARKYMTDRYENYMKEIETVRNAIDKIIMKKFVQIEEMCNNLTDLQRRFEASQIKAVNAGKFLNNVYLESQKQIKEQEFVKETSWQIYEHICKRSNKPPVFKGQPLKQLEVIKKTLRKLRLVNRVVEAIREENWTRPEEGESTSDSIVANVVHKYLSKK